jgi:TPR repeat protein
MLRYCDFVFLTPYYVTISGGMLRLAGLSCALALVLSSPVIAAGNFEFVVPAEPGLTLEITIYGGTGTPLAGPTTIKSNDGGAYRLVVDETPIKADPPGRWCVELVEGRSDKLSTGKMVCDDAPTDMRGTYTFKFPEPNVVDSRRAQELFGEGFAYDTGSGRAKDDVQAAKYYQMAVDAGSIEAARNLAGMYGSGRGVPLDNEKAGALFRMAAEGGDAQAQYALANWYINDRAEKLVWLRKAAGQKHAEAIALLAQMEPKESGGAAPEPAAPAAQQSTWHVADGGEGRCAAAASPVTPDARLKGSEMSQIFVLNSPGKDPNLVVVGIPGPVDKSQIYVDVDGVMYPTIYIPNQRQALLLVRSVDAQGKAQLNESAAHMLANKALVHAMKLGQTLTVHVTVRDGPAVGTIYDEVYSLAGFAEAKAQSDAKCAGGK